ncbi:hypothetical protein DCC85_21170 [Paenibacillus sp. CAA11]|nr:hypothetical protein DCC85_21170 [Paenibacillus sp. CAA11]
MIKQLHMPDAALLPNLHLADPKAAEGILVKDLLHHYSSLRLSQANLMLNMYKSMFLILQIKNSFTSVPEAQQNRLARGYPSIFSFMLPTDSPNIPSIWLRHISFPMLRI